MLLLRPREDAALSAKAPEVREILVALDGSRRAEAVLPAAAALAGILGAKLVLIQMVRPVVLKTDPPLPFPTGYDDELTRLTREQAQDYLDGVVQRLNAQGLSTTGVAVLGGSAFDAIQEASRAPGTGMLALATHGRGGVRRMVLGSVADKLVRGGELPVLVTRPKGR
jgi:nucleotide-binding universal stress UspA family protein